ncbi:hypothetical protein NPIL_409211 [Nephila pilipes]|uniref:Uncharacterized protein n=1 Tax=Nephila pilipes TaxID=299642 RepID=A0A8X6QKI0_NEPPI|nr:hypothetical protein NPIL_409211 [Nephila pilipes]
MKTAPAPLTISKCGSFEDIHLPANTHVFENYRKNPLPQNRMIIQFSTFHNRRDALLYVKEISDEKNHSPFSGVRFFITVSRNTSEVKNTITFPESIEGSHPTQYVWAAQKQMCDFLLN